jgi:hypothetical protein
MTLASALFGVSDAPYVAGSVYQSIPYVAEGVVASPVNTDVIVPFVPRATFTLDKVAWSRDQATAANVYVGLYNAAGTLLTDCAVDTDTTTGWHLVDTTNVVLRVNQLYYLAWNGSADVASTHRVASTPEATIYFLDRYGTQTNLGLSNPGAAQKARTNAALLSTLTLSGWANMTTNAAILMGVVPA